MEMFDPEKKIFHTPEALSRWREALRKEGKRVVLTNGCFDLLHRGHAQYLLGARRTGEALLVLLNSDESVKALKGPGRPVNTQLDRAYVLASLAFVDGVYIFSSSRCDKEIAFIQPDIYAKGADYTIDKLDKGELAALQECNAEIAFIPLVPGLSTTILLARGGGGK